MESIADTVKRMNTRPEPASEPTPQRETSDAAWDLTRALASLSPRDQGRVMERINRRMVSIFGAPWSSTMAGEDLDVWRRAMGAATLGDVRRGLEACIDGTYSNEHGFPPNLHQFLALCKPAPRPAYHRDWRENALALPAPEKITAPGDARAHLQGIRAMLRPKVGGDS